MGHKPEYIRESERFLADSGLWWHDVVDLYAIQRKRPDIADLIQDVIDWIMGR